MGMWLNLPEKKTDDEDEKSAKCVQSAFPQIHEETCIVCGSKEWEATQMSVIRPTIKSVNTCTHTEEHHAAMIKNQLYFHSTWIYLKITLFKSNM